MRPKFVDTIASEAGIELDEAGPDTRSRAAKAEAYDEWRRTRVVFMHPCSDLTLPLTPSHGDLPLQRDGAAP